MHTEPTIVPVREIKAPAGTLATAEQVANFIEQAPVGICTLRGPTHVFEVANDIFRQLAAGRRDLIGNAIKFTPAEGEIVIDCAAKGDMIAIAVRDTGIGIPADKLGSIFEPFVQVGRKFSTNSEGVGLGLTISREFARGMGGDFSVESEVGAGSTFILQLPAA